MGCAQTREKPNSFYALKGRINDKMYQTCCHERWKNDQNVLKGKIDNLMISVLKKKKQNQANFI